jgi:glucosyl-3-phosphoglycerate synthase
MSEKRPRVLLAVSENANLDQWIKLALALNPQEIYLRGLITIPSDKSLSEGTIQVRAFRDSLSALAQEYPTLYEQAEARVDYCPMELVLAEIRTLKIDLLLVQWPGPTLSTGGVSSNEILEHAPCDVALIRGEAWNVPGSVLVSLRGGPNFRLSMRIANALAQSGNITVFHASSPRQIIDFARMLIAEPLIRRVVTTQRTTYEGIVAEAAGHKAIVLGATFQSSEMTMSRTSPLVEQLSENLDVPIILVRSWHPEGFQFQSMRPLWEREENLSTRVDRWFAGNTFHSHEFNDLQALLALKEKQGVSISVGLPALNESETVGTVIRTLKQALMHEIPLVDEIVLIDSNSTDDTVAIAEQCEIPVYRHPEILPEMSSYPGKGEALWKSLHVLKGDIIVWIDTDITNIHPRFVYGLLGPLLRNPNVQYVKGFYRRPINVDGVLQATGGGRVTELVARPMLNLFYPELSGIIQPLSGEYAGRRQAFECIPFFSGYGVETGLLIDLHQQFGLDAIAQVDLEERIHYNQPLEGLSKMAFAITQVFIARLESRYGVSLLEHTNRSMKLIVSEPDRFALDIVAIGDVERPPINTVQGYRR